MSGEQFINLIRKPNIRAMIGIGVVFAFIAYVFLLFFKLIPANNKDIILPAAGYLAAKFGTVVDWHFGGSKDKSDQEKVDAAKDLSAN